MTYDQPKRRPGVRSDAYILRNRQWAALVRLWLAGDTGIDRDELLYGREGFTLSPTLSRLQAYKPEPLIAYFKPTPTPYSAAYRITDAGRSFYRDHWHFYRARYPTVEAPEPNDR